MFLAKYDDKIINIPYKNVYQRTWKLVDCKIYNSSTCEIVIDFAIHQLSGPLISTMWRHRKETLYDKNVNWCNGAIGQWVSETFSELILFSTTIGTSCHTIMKQVNATLSNYLEREILCIEILWLTVADLGNSFWHSPKIFILFLQLGIEGVT